LPSIIVDADVTILRRKRLYVVGRLPDGTLVRRKTGTRQWTDASEPLESAPTQITATSAHVVCGEAGRGLPVPLVVGRRPRGPAWQCFPGHWRCRIHDIRPVTSTGQRLLLPIIPRAVFLADLDEASAAKVDKIASTHPPPSAKSRREVTRLRNSQNWASEVVDMIVGEGIVTKQKANEVWATIGEVTPFDEP
jgi:hypothetical protein